MDKKQLTGNRSAVPDCPAPSIPAIKPTGKRHTGQKIRCRFKGMIRRITVFSLLLALTLSLAACSGSAPGTPGGSSNESGGSGNGSVTSAGSGPDNEYLEQLKLGDQALQEGRFDDAITAYTNALKIDPSIPQAYHRIFDTYVRDERYDEALTFARQHYDNIDTKAVVDQRSENKEYTYEMESSAYNGMTASNELAQFLTSYLDLGCHYPSYMNGVYPDTDMMAFMDFTGTVHPQLGDSTLSGLYEQTEKTGSLYASIFGELEEAGIDPNRITPGAYQSSSGISFSDTENKEDPTPETIEAFEAKFREILELDPDLLFVYRDMASLYALIGDNVSAGEIYLESIQAMKDMKQRRSYVSGDAKNLLRSALQYNYETAAEEISRIKYPGKPVYGFTFYENDDSAEETSVEEITVDPYLRGMDEIMQESESILTTEAEKATLKNMYETLSVRLQDSIDKIKAMKEDVAVPDTNVEGDATLLVYGKSSYRPETYDPASGWLCLHYTGEKGYSLPIYLVNTKYGKVIFGQEDNEPRICSENILQFKWIDRKTGEHVSYDYIYSDLVNADEADSNIDDFYMVTYDLEGNILEEKELLKFEDLTIDNYAEQTNNAIASATQGYTILSNNNWNNINISFDGNDGIVQAGGVTLRKTFDEEKTKYMSISNAYLNSSEGILIVNWYGYGTEIYKLK